MNYPYFKELSDYLVADSFFAKSEAVKTITALGMHFVSRLRDDVVVMDCDYPQWSVHKLRKRETEQVSKNAFYLKKAKGLFQEIGKWTYPVVPTQPEKVLEDTLRFLSNEKEKYDLVLFDLPGTVNNKSVIQVYFNMDYLFVPITTSRINMESTLSFIVTINDILKASSSIPLKNIFPFWNRIMHRERRELLACYEGAIAELGVSIMQTRIPNSVRFDREQSITGKDRLFLSTVFPPDKPLLKGSNWGLFISEFLKLTDLKRQV